MSETMSTPRVLAAVAEWIWAPEGARAHESEGLTLVEYPEYFELPTQAFVLDSDRNAEGLVREAEEVASGWERHTLWWSVTDTTRPEGLEPELLRRGAEVTERADILAIPLTGKLPRLDPPPGLELREATDLATMRDALLVEAEAFESESEVTDERAARSLAETDYSAGGPPRGRFVAYAAGIPVASAGWTQAGEVLRLWGAGTTLAARGTGAYRAVLDQRLRRGQDLGCVFAVTTGRVATSSPILQRNGFRRYGERRVLKLAVGRPATA